ncbi:hypothetical protein EYZ11_004923 [Aspergillus tanneri]|uniref:A-kinase anchor protein 7-like phosphoesterase domain-containing protein n=1 Tax=Aspergillus tanneri TaxID=1220188 RepID=A0A4S3JLP3_9EURO|nr:uncharacterized protein ATNIH1004_004661 [Aspergillus tanneri]KAA8648776.1 hypothetical protein ATNIH1004_004661 [Aspergillus tanneri]THC95608.1 hypothetical protein EYZ11_004923 [Aspergillus tanneri]
MPQKKKNPGPSQPKEKRPPLTHFLCLPLVNSISLPQFESSFAAFKDAIPPTRPDQTAPWQEPRPLIPHGAVRPIGTLHLTLGVMSLASQERLDGAIRFLQSLDLVSLMREAESIARSCTKGKPTSPLVQAGQQDEPAPDPFTISLESLHALPRARSATVLHAAPVDSTSRLYPFCEILRDKFAEAGFLKIEYKKDPPPEPTTYTQASTTIPEDTAQPIPRSGTTAPPNKPKHRPLLLHATVVNTIYIKGRSRGGGASGSHRKNQYSFDARDMLTHFRDYYVDSARTMPRSPAIAVPADDSDSSEDRSEKEYSFPDNSASSENPFIWAKGFPLESVCICEMGAKKLEPEAADEDGLNARLQEKYRVVATRRLDFQPLCIPPV